MSAAGAAARRATAPQRLGNVMAALAAGTIGRVDLVTRAAG
jgi:hypothetical protein